MIELKKTPYTAKVKSSGKRRRRLVQYYDEDSGFVDQDTLTSTPGTYRNAMTPKNEKFVYAGPQEQDESFSISENLDTTLDETCDVSLNDSALNMSSAKHVLNDTIANESSGTCVVSDIVDGIYPPIENMPRRSKRRRIKPLKWYKGEHLVYERSDSGIGLVLPIVAGVERAGTKTPM